MINRSPVFNEEASLKSIGTEIIAYMFGVPPDIVQRAINEMKEKQEVKDIINRYTQCNEDI